MTNGNASKRAHATPTKDFFVRMITRDISLGDCIVDLLDNSMDGARRTVKRTGRDGGWQEDVRLLQTQGARQVMPSFEGVDYSIRTNKNIERKLVFDKLCTMDSAFQFSAYRYVGLGSMWFVDFIMAHRILGIGDLWSLEDSNAERAEFNKPYSCIRVLAGTSSTTLAGMPAADWQTPAIVWFDYDGAFHEDVRSDAVRLLERLSTGSVLLVTVNADRRSYRPPGPADQSARAIDRLTELFGDAVPPQIIPGGTGGHWRGRISEHLEFGDPELDDWFCEDERAEHRRDAGSVRSAVRTSTS